MQPRALAARVVPLLQATLRNRFFQWNMFGNVGPLVFALFTVPYLYTSAPREYVGFLTLTWAAIGYTGIFDFGLSRALFYYAAASKADPRSDVAGAVRKSILFAVVVSLVLNGLLLVWRGEVAALLKLTSADQINALLIIAASLPIYLVSNMIRSSLEGLELFADANIFKFVSYASLFLCPAALIASGDGLLSHVCLAYGAVRLLACLYVFARLRPHLSAQQTHAERTAIPFGAILGFGGWATVSSTISPLMVYGDRFALAFMQGAAAMAIYALLQEFIGKTILLSASYVTSIQPRLGYLPVREAETLYRQEHRNVVLLSVVVYTGCLIVSPFFVAWWLGVAMHDVAFLAIILSIGFMFNSMAQIPLTYLLARGHPRRIAASHIVEALLYFPLLIGAARLYGITGAAVVGVLRQIFDYGMLSWQARRRTD